MDLILSFSAPTRENRRIPLHRPQALIGRGQEAEILLDHPAVSRRHARLVFHDNGGMVALEDGGSANGTLVDGMPLSGRSRLHPDQVVGIGPFRFSVCTAPAHSAATAGPGPRPVTPAAQEEMVRLAAEMLPQLMPPPVQADTKDPECLAREAHRLLYPRVLELLPAHTGPEEAERITRRALTCALGLGPLEAWLSDPTVSEIMVNGLEGVYLERGGKLFRQPPVFDSERSLMRVVERILAPLGRRVDETTPYVDGRLPDGSRINVVIPPVSLVGPVVTIRKFSARRLRMEDLVGAKTLTGEAADFLSQAVKARRNILVSGGTGTGKTTFLNILAAFIPPEERIVTIEDAAELALLQDHVLRLEVRPPNLEGRGEVGMRELVRNSLRMRPDRVIVGECRGGEALDMLQAMNTGHEGSMTTCHANTPRDALKRVETMALMGGLDLPHRVIREQVSSAIHLVVQLARLSDGRRAVDGVVEVTGMEGEQILTQEIFRLDRKSGDGCLLATGLVPRFLQTEGGRR